MKLWALFSREWLLTTLLVIAGSVLCMRLGIWQLDRLTQRKEFNAEFEAMRSAPLLDLNNGVPQNITAMEWRAAEVSGEYDSNGQIALRNQYNNGEYGYHLVTPLIFDGGAVLVDRGWIPADGNSAPEDWHQYDQTGPVKLTGQIRLGQAKPAIGGVEDALPGNGEKLFLWNNLDIDRISAQLPYPILKIYFQPEVVNRDAAPPIPFQPIIDINNGPHLGYAIQWFFFSVILLFGYPYYFRKQVMKK